jgi:hypothetical protein
LSLRGEPAAPSTVGGHEATPAFVTPRAPPRQAVRIGHSLRTSVSWRPHSTICKRMNVPVPTLSSDDGTCTSSMSTSGAAPAPVVLSTQVQAHRAQPSDAMSQSQALFHAQVGRFVDQVRVVAAYEDTLSFTTCIAAPLHSHKHHPLSNRALHLTL